MKRKRFSLLDIKLYDKPAVNKLVLALKETYQLYENPKAYPGQTLLSVFPRRPEIWPQYVGSWRLNEKLRLSARPWNRAIVIAGQ